ncbi:Glycosyltransferase involved in cell wall bisynthesis [Pseudarcicella hirudinis]|uniref:Glycosyltransferase involved in cell wall bisynthesis n=1 Tax=Pseudarcicella hirudinis TaxID=1079859 RepID=A0A1I5YPS6_9BACT|nr:glycosyltransferase family 4 protein [Pseudarcicella hirudinis]SFQ46055.1 Glycosyltransferase involved in cell wall bisynthesis [Pseudarcicella hirudinis]
MNSLKRITLVHPANELYGSDKMFLLIVETVRKSYSDAIINVVLPCEGPLSELLQKFNVNLIIRPLGILRKAELKKLDFSVFTRLFTNRKFYHDLLKETDLLYINTAVVLDFIIYSRFYKLKKFIHIHEIPTGASKTLFFTLIKYCKASLIHISKAVQLPFSTINTRHFIVPNGIQAIPEQPVRETSSGKINILLIGRINNWKGQNLLVEAVDKLSDELKNQIDVRIVGDVYGDQIHFKNDLLENIKHRNLEHLVKVLPFSPTPEIHYNWSDIVVIPSLKPEPFGLVAIEGMSVGKVVIAANHGGLTEIIEDNVSGILFTPNDSAELAEKISGIVLNPAVQEKFYTNAIKAYKESYTPEVYINNLMSILKIQ